MRQLCQVLSFKTLPFLSLIVVASEDEGYNVYLESGLCRKVPCTGGFFMFIMIILSKSYLINYTCSTV